MKNIDLKSLIIGVLFTSTIFLSINATPENLNSEKTLDQDEIEEWLFGYRGYYRTSIKAYIENLESKIDYIESQINDIQSTVDDIDYKVD